MDRKSGIAERRGLLALKIVLEKKLMPPIWEVQEFEIYHNTIDEDDISNIRTRRFCPIMDDAEYCQGSRCMAWRTVAQDTTAGYCGMAGPVARNLRREAEVAADMLDGVETDLRTVNAALDKLGPAAA